MNCTTVHFWHCHQSNEDAHWTPGQQQMKKCGLPMDDWSEGNKTNADKDNRIWFFPASNTHTHTHRHHRNMNVSSTNKYIAVWHLCMLCSIQCIFNLKRLDFSRDISFTADGIWQQQTVHNLAYCYDIVIVIVSCTYVVVVVVSVSPVWQGFD